MSQIVNEKSKRITVLDGLKGFSLLIVIAFFFIQHIVPGGFLMVNVFFFISGLLNFRYFHRLIVRDDEINYLAYYKRRFEQLFFPKLFMMVLSVVFVLFFSKQNYVNLRGISFSSFFFVNNLYQLINGHSYFSQVANQSIFAHLWSVSMYGQFVLLTPLLVQVSYRWNKNRSIATNILAVISIVSMVFMFYLHYIGSTNASIYFNPMARLSAYSMGGIMGILLPIKLIPKEKSRKTSLLVNICGILVVILMALMVRYMYGTQPFSVRIGFSLFNLLIGAFVFITLYPKSFLNKLFSLSPLVSLGQKSYAYYLWAYPIYLILPNLLKQYNQNYWIFGIVGLLLLIAFSELTHYLFGSHKISLPFGQDVNIEKSKYQLEYLRKHRGALKQIKIISISYVVIFIIGIIGILMAPQIGAGNNEALSQTLEQNKVIVRESTDPNITTPIVINNIEGLDQSIKLYANALEITFIGDAIFLASAQEIKNVFPKAVIDAEEGRQLYNSIAVIERLKNNQKLSNSVVVLLGTNGSFTRGQLEDYIEAIGNDHNIYFVLMNASRIWTKDVNQKIYQAAQKYSHVRMIDWASYANSHEDWLIDEFHPSQKGALEMAKLIASELYRQK